MRAAAALLALLASACTAEPWQPPNILLVSLDTLRADHLSIYGYERDTAPRLAELARASVVFERAYTHAPLTLPSHTSLLTGTYPARHGVQERGDTLGPGSPTLAGLIRERGYRTAAFTNAYFLSRDFGLDRGFDHYDYVHDLRGQRDAEGTNQAILGWLEFAGDAPTFVFAHYFDVHSDWERLPYDAPERYRERFAESEPKGFPAGDGVVFASRYMARMNRESIAYSEAERAYVVGLYDAGVAYTDTQLGKLLDALEASGWLERAIVIVTSDHGEEFQEHGRLLHTQLYEEHLRVPLLVSLPEMRGGSRSGCRAAGDAPAPRAGRSAELVQLVDVLPTLLACLGAPQQQRVQGGSFLAALGGGPTGREAAYFDHPRRDRAGVLHAGWKLIDSPNPDEVELYDLASDRAERRNLAAEEPERVRALREQLTAHRARSEQGAEIGPTRAVPESVHQQLEALGYVD